MYNHQIRNNKLIKIYKKYNKEIFKMKKLILFKIKLIKMS